MGNSLPLLYREQKGAIFPPRKKHAAKQSIEEIKGSLESHIELEVLTFRISNDQRCFWGSNLASGGTYFNLARTLCPSSYW